MMSGRSTQEAIGVENKQHGECPTNRNKLLVEILEIGTYWQTKKKIMDIG